METTIGDIINWGVQFLGAASDYAATLDGRTAFFLGAVAMFLIERAIHKLTGAIRTAIIVTALVMFGGPGIYAAFNAFGSDAKAGINAAAGTASDTALTPTRKMMDNFNQHTGN